MTEALAGIEPVFHRAFVGREAQLALLRAAFGRACAGQGSLVMVVGEPGIGKTALCEQLAAYVAEQGGRTLAGHCYEEGSLSLPYLPFVTAMRSHVIAQRPDTLRDELGAGAGYVARIVPEVCERLDVTLTPPGDPEEDRRRLLQAVVDFLRNIAAPQPLLLVLEDLHDADKGTLDLLNHLARNLSGARLLVMGTYRDVEVDRAHPLSAALAELRRVSAFERVLLRGLTLEEVHGLLNVMTGQDVRATLAEAVYRQTEGNPLFVQEVFRYLVDAGHVSRREGRWRRTGEEPPEAFIPEGLRDVIGQRLSRLSETCNRVLATAAVIGREFRLDVLQRVSGAADEDLLAALEEATRAAIIEQRAAVGAGAMFRFAHALFRQTLYEEMFVPRRIRVHQQVGRALEQVYARSLEEHAAEMADHFAQSTEEEDLEKALRYSELAAQRSMEVYAYGEAARLLEQALKVQDVLGPSDKAKRCDLLLALGEALMPAGEPGRVVQEVSRQAFSLATIVEDRRRAARACRLALEALHRYGAINIWHGLEWRQWAERADQYAVDGTIERVYADLAMARVRVAEERPGDGIGLFLRALELARKLDDQEALFSAAWLAIFHLWTPEHWVQACQLAEEFAARFPERVSPRTLALVREFSGWTLIALGDRPKGEALIRGVHELAEETGDVYPTILWSSFQPLLATMEGRLEEAVGELKARLLKESEALGLLELGKGFAANRTVFAMMYLGRFEEAADAIRIARQVPEALADAYVGRRSEAVEGLRRFLASSNGQSSRLFVLLAYLEVALLVKDLDAVENLSSRLQEFSHLSGPVGPAHGSLGRFLGDGALLLGAPEKALFYYRQGLSASTRIGHRPEMAVLRTRLAELLLDHFPDALAEAAEHLVLAIPELRDMKMQPALEKALALQEHLQAAKAKPAPRQHPDGLTEREVEVLRLIAAGRTDREIGEALFISTRTVGNHVSNILAKTGAANRTEATAYAARSSLI